MTQRLDLIQAVHSQGRRLTRQRQLVLEILEQSQEHLDAESVYRLARERDKRIGIATVYRTLALLKELGLVDEHQFGKGYSHFEAIQDDEPHFHFTCINCGKVIEFQSPQIMALVYQSCESGDLRVVDVSLHCSGYCSQCRALDLNCE